MTPAEQEKIRFRLVRDYEQMAGDLFQPRRQAIVDVAALLTEVEVLRAEVERQAKVIAAWRERRDVLAVVYTETWTSADHRAWGKRERDSRVALRALGEEP